MDPVDAIVQMAELAHLFGAYSGKPLATWWTSPRAS
jgi:hypothetical protein